MEPAPEPTTGPIPEPPPPDPGVVPLRRLETLEFDDSVSSNVGRGARHSHDLLPMSLAGRGGGAWTTGRHILFEPEHGG